MMINRARLFKKDPCLKRLKKEIEERTAAAEPEEPEDPPEPTHALRFIRRRILRDTDTDG